MGKIRTLARNLGTGAVVFLLFATVVGVAGAQRPDSAPATGARPNAGQGRDGHHGARGELRDAYVKQLAVNLGLPEETVRAAAVKTREDLRPMMQERMQQFHNRMREGAQHGARPNWFEGLRERFHERFRDGREGPAEGAGPFRGGAPREGFGPVPGGPPFGAPGQFRGGPPMGGPRDGNGMDPISLIAEILRMDPTALRGEMQQGKSLAQVAQEHGVAPTALADQLAARMEDARRQQAREMIERMLNQTMPPGGPRSAPSRS